MFLLLTRYHYWSDNIIKVEVGRTQEISEGNVARALQKEFQSSRT